MGIPEILSTEPIVTQATTEAGKVSVSFWAEAKVLGKHRHMEVANVVLYPGYGCRIRVHPCPIGWADRAFGVYKQLQAHGETDEKPTHEVSWRLGYPQFRPLV